VLVIEIAQKNDDGTDLTGLVAYANGQNRRV